MLYHCFTSSELRCLLWLKGLWLKDFQRTFRGSNHFVPESEGKINDRKSDNGGKGPGEIMAVTYHAQTIHCETLPPAV